MFQGSIVALVTPMDARGRIDFAALRNLVDFHMRAGSDGLVIAGTTGEGAVISPAEFRDLLSAVVARVKGRVPVIAGTGSVSAETVARMNRVAAEAGADAALVVTPYYVRPPQRGLVAYFNAIADAADLPLVLYNVPARTAVDMLPETVAQLARRAGIVAIKEALPDPARIRRLVELCGEDLVVLSGDDATCKEALLAGASGVVSVAANVVPERMHELCRRAEAGDRTGSAEIDGELRELFRVLAVEPNPIPVKWLVAKMGLMGGGIRLPLLPLDANHQAGARQCLKSLGLLAPETQEQHVEKV